MNLRANYPLPTGDVVPHMQTGNQAPIFDAAARYPVLLFSHGLTGSPISVITSTPSRVFASWGYVVVAPFHGDLRFADVKLENFSDIVYADPHQDIRRHAGYTPALSFARSRYRAGQPAVRGPR
jgi:predicted dienelactone hydrolase